jgi:outer membrane immunogenic protein
VISFTRFPCRRALASLTGRVGFTVGPALLYVKGGYAYSDNRETLTFLGRSIAFAFDRWGNRPAQLVDS